MKILFHIFGIVILCCSVTLVSTTEQWGVFEASFIGPTKGNPFVDVELFATFSLNEKKLENDKASVSVRVRGFYSGNGTYKIRFMPSKPGDWDFLTNSKTKELNHLNGSFVVTPANKSKGNHGPVHAVQTKAGSSVPYISFADGTPHVSVGTTSYAWIQQNSSVRQETLNSLKKGPFNKMRMCVFPKWYVYNHDEPPDGLYPYVGSPPTEWKFDKFNTAFWDKLDSLVDQLMALNVQADIIIFHPYDGKHWGFDCMGGREYAKYDITPDLMYLKYLVARLGAYRNVWWSMANEWNNIRCKYNESDGKTPIWDAYFQLIQNEDPYNHMCGIHNGRINYNHSQPWITHMSIQHEQYPQTLWDTYGYKPIIWDEVAYEGDIPSTWGQLSGPQMTDRFWWGTTMGCNVGHGETILNRSLHDDDKQVLWWSKGGKLRGFSPDRIQWYRDFINSPSHPPFHELKANRTNQTATETSVLYSEGKFYLFRFNGLSEVQNSYILLPPGQYLVSSINTWQMTITPMENVTGGDKKISISHRGNPHIFSITRHD